MNTLTAKTIVKIWFSVMWIDFDLLILFHIKIDSGHDIIAGGCSGHLIDYLQPLAQIFHLTKHSENTQFKIFQN